MTAITKEAREFRDKLADILNFKDWRIRGKSGDIPVRRQIMSAFLYEAYNGKLSLKTIGSLSGYRSRSRHTSVLFNVGKVNDDIVIGDAVTTPLYRQARKVFREFEFKAPIDKKEGFIYLSTAVRPEHKAAINNDASKAGCSASEVLRGILDDHYFKA